LIAPFALSGGPFETGPLASAAQVSFLSWLIYPLLSTKPLLRFALARQHVPEHDPVPSSDVDHLYAATHQFGAEHAPMALISGRLSSDITPQFDALQQPSLLIWGAKALHAAPDPAQERFSARANVETVQIPGANEYVHEEFPALVIANILQWSATQQAQAPEQPTSKPEPVLAPEQPTSEPEPAPEQPTSKLEPAPAPEQSAAEPEPAHEQGHEAQLVVEAYCPHCKRKTIMAHPREGVTKNGRPIVQGTCSVCGTRQNRMGRLSS
jgi:hypothetical protein